MASYGPMIHIDWPYGSHTHGSFGLSWCITEVTHYLPMLEVAAQGILLPQTALALWHSWQCEWIAPSSCVLATVSWFNRIQHVCLLFLPTILSNVYVGASKNNLSLDFRLSVTTTDYFTSFTVSRLDCAAPWQCQISTHAHACHPRWWQM